MIGDNLGNKMQTEETEIMKNKKLQLEHYHLSSSYSPG